MLFSCSPPKPYVYPFFILMLMYMPEHTTGLASVLHKSVHAMLDWESIIECNCFFHVQVQVMPLSAGNFLASVAKSFSHLAVVVDNDTFTTRRRHSRRSIDRFFALKGTAHGTSASPATPVGSAPLPTSHRSIFALI